MVYVVMGISGSGKSTVGKLLAGKLGLPFHDADEDHSPANIEKMRMGVARQPAAKPRSSCGRDSH